MAARLGQPGVLEGLAAHLRADVLGACDEWRFARATDKWALASASLHALLLLLPPAEAAAEHATLCHEQSRALGAGTGQDADGTSQASGHDTRWWILQFAAL